MKYKYMDQDEQDDVVARALISREKEHHSYEINRINYVAMIEKLNQELPAELPDTLKSYAVMAGEQLAEALDTEEFGLVSKYNFRERLKVLLQTTLAEQNKVESVYTALEAALPEGERLQAAIARVRLST